MDRDVYAVDVGIVVEIVLADHVYGWSVRSPKKRAMFGLVDAAVVRLIVEVETRYPEFR